MSTLSWKSIKTYFLIFLAGFAIVSFLTYAMMKENYNNLTDYEIKTQSPKVKITEFKSTYSYGYINGSVTNNTGEHIPSCYLRIDLYNSNDIYLGTEYKELKYFNVNETINFEINFDYAEVDKAIINVVDEIKKENSVQDSKESGKSIAGINVEPVITDETMEIAVPIAGCLLGVTALGIIP